MKQNKFLNADPPSAAKSEKSKGTKLQPRKKVTAVTQKDEQEEGPGEGDTVEVEEDGSKIPALQPKPGAEVRNFHLRDNDFILNSYTPGCRGCRAIAQNLRPVGHSEECHRRNAI